MVNGLYNSIRQYLKNRIYKFDIEKVNKILVIAPHPDDESIGMGGFLTKYKSKCEVLLLTNGACGNPQWSKEKTIEVRKQEFQDAMTYIGIEKYYMLGVMDQEARKHLSVLKKYLESKYDYIFVPSRYDIHPDHSCLYKYVKRHKNKKSIIVEYEVWSPLRNPNFYLDISDCYKEKEITIQKHVSQIERTQYDWGSIGLNMYRGMISGNRYAEAYFINKPLSAKILDKMKKIKDNMEKSRESKR